MMPSLKTVRGRPMPFGATQTPSGYNFALFSRHAFAVTLLVFFQKGTEADHEIMLDSNKNRTGDVWHIHVEGLPAGFYYMYRVDGPWNPEAGLIFNPDHLLLDPYARLITGLERWGEKDSGRHPLLGRVDSIEYDWGDDRPPNTPLSDSIIYELHVRGFTQHPGSGVSCPGTYKGIVEKIDHLKNLGITAIELLPIHEFDETDCRYRNPDTGERLLNFWGYSTIGFFALKTGYASENSGKEAVREFRDMVKALHAENLEVILDVVFNHTAEGDRECPVLNYKGIENATYYILDETGDYRNYSGCGNTMNCNHPVVQNLILDALRYWVAEMHVDGFRFDLASILTRDENGQVLAHPPLLESIAKDPVLSHVKIIAEAWDAAGLYQVGSFPASKRWAEWNGQYRDILRRFVCGEPGITAEVASRLSGSEDLYRHSERHPYHSINFITAHDGFTMLDLVSYQKKRNEANGQQNLDGQDQNFSMNCGVEGETTNSGVLARRFRQIRNMATLLMLSQGTPMILAGDEFGNSQSGNNNAWCQDNEISWLNWELVDHNSDLLLFWKRLIAFRKRFASLRRKRFFTGKICERSGIADVSWHNERKGQPDFDAPAQSLAFMIDEVEVGGRPGGVIYVAANFKDTPLDFEIPARIPGRRWCLTLSTFDPKAFINGEITSLAEDQETIQVPPFSIWVLTC